MMAPESERATCVKCGKTKDSVLHSAPIVPLEMPHEYESAAPLTCSEVVERLPIVLVGDPVLREIAKPVTGDEQELVDLLCRTMKGAHALGLAAPQIGVSKRVAVVQMSEDDSATVLINPRIIDMLGEEIAEEGCLSIPDVRLPIKRWYTISVESNGALIGTFRGLMARAIQHEIDHLDGILITDRTRELHSWRERRAQELEELLAKHSLTPEPQSTQLDTDTEKEMTTETRKNICGCNCHKHGEAKPCFYCANAHNFYGAVAPERISDNPADPTGHGAEGIKAQVATMFSNSEQIRKGAKHE